MSYTTSLSLNLSCGRTYTFTVRAVTRFHTVAESKVTVSIKPQAGPVTNLAIKVVAENNDTDGFLLMWGPPKNAKTTSIKVGDNCGQFKFYNADVGEVLPPYFS